MNILRLTSLFFFLAQAAAASDTSRTVRRRAQDDGDNKESGDSRDSSDSVDDMKNMITQNIKRLCEKSAKSDSVKAECSAKGGKMKDKIKFEISAGKTGAEIDVKYKGKNRTDLVETETEEEYAIIFHSIVEYKPKDEAAPFDFDTETVVQEMMIEKWADFSDIVEDADGVSKFHVSTDDEIARFDFHLSQEENDIRNLSANSVKVDVSITTFPWMQNDTYLALLCSIEAETEIKYDYEKPDSDDMEETEVKLEHPKDVRIALESSPMGSTARPFGKFDWVTTAEMNNNTYIGEVVASTPSDAKKKDEKKIAFSFLDSSNAEKIYWDPEAGIGYEESDTSGSFVTLTNAALSVSAIAATISFFSSV